MRYSPIFFILFCLFSCQKEILIEQNSPKKVVVINCLFTNNTIFKLELFYTQPAFSKVDKEIITNGNVKIFENNLFFDSLVLNNISKKYESVKIPKAGSKYKVVVNIPNQKEITAEDIIPNNSVVVNSFAWDTINTISVFDPDFLFYYDVNPLKISFVDNDVSNKYYKVIGRKYHKYLLESDTNHNENNFYIWYVQSDNKLFSMHSEIPYLLFENKLNQNVPLEINGFSNYNNFFIDSTGYANRSFDPILNGYPTWPKRDKWYYEYYLDFYTLSINYYNYNTTYLKQNLNNSSVFSEYQSVYSNVQSGTGIFASYVKSRIKVY